MLSWSAEATQRTVDLGGIVDPTNALGVVAGRELVAVGDLAVGAMVDASAVRDLAATIGGESAVRAAAVAGAFELYNRIVDAVGLPVGRAQREALGDIVATLGLGAFPHAGHGL